MVPPNIFLVLLSLALTWPSKAFCPNPLGPPFYGQQPSCNRQGIPTKPLVRPQVMAPVTIFEIPLPPHAPWEQRGVRPGDQTDPMGHMGGRAFVSGGGGGLRGRYSPLAQSLKGGRFGTRPWWLAPLACGGAYWPLALEPSAMTSRHPYSCGLGGEGGTAAPPIQCATRHTPRPPARAPANCRGAPIPNRTARGACSAPVRSAITIE